MDAARSYTEVDLPHVFVAGSERALVLLRRALRALPGLFVSHLPVEGPRCVEALKRSERGMFWLSSWAVSNADYVAAHLERACFIVIKADREVGPALHEGRCLHLSEAGLEETPGDEVARLMEFLDSA